MYIQSDDMIGDPKFAKFSKDIREKYKELKEKNYYQDNLYNIVKINAELMSISNNESRIEKIIKNVNDLAWWIPIRKLRDKFRNKVLSGI